jgi:hypothetical protein
MDCVQDNDNQCANTPTGAEVDAAGCALEVNIAPTVSLIATQGWVTMTSVNTDAGSVTIEANVVDENQGDEHTYVWTVSGISTLENNGNAISFDPSGLANVPISITVEASDNAQPALSDEITITLSVLTPSTQVSPTTQNSDLAGGSINLLLLFGLVLLHTIRLISKGIRI